MRSIRFNEFGEPAEKLRIEDAPRPEPQAGEVLVKLTARAINPSDLLTVRGLYGSLPTLPATPGLEGAGVIEELGAGVTGWTPGQRVIPLGVPGTWQEYLCVPAVQLLPTPDAMPDNIAAQFVVNPLTAWIMCLEELRVQPGEWLLQTAAGSTLGRMVIQLGKLRGFKTINVVRRRAQAQEILELGADEVICTEDENLVARVYKITGGAGLRAAIDAVGGEVGGDVVNSLGRGGVLLVYGLLSMQPIPLQSGIMIFKSSTVRGFWLTDWMQTAPVETRNTVVLKLMQALAGGKLIPPIEAEYDLADIRAAVEHAEREGRSGKVLLVG